MNIKHIKLILLLLLFNSFCFGQNDRIILLEKILNSKTSEFPGLNEEIKLSISDADISSFLRGIGKQHSLNIALQNDIKGEVTNDFNNAKVLDVFIYVCQEYALEIDFIGSLILFKNYKVPILEKEIITKDLSITYDTSNTFLTLNLQRDTLFSVIEKISLLSGYDVIADKDLRKEVLSGFIQNRPLPVALERIAEINKIDLIKTKDNFYIFKKRKIRPIQRQINANRNSAQQNSGEFDIIAQDGLLQVNAKEVSFEEIIDKGLKEIGYNYILLDPLPELTTFFVSNIESKDFVQTVLQGSKYSFIKKDDIYLIGNHKTEGLNKTKLIQLKKRSIEKVLAVIPAEWQKDLTIVEFPDLNGFLVTGSENKITQLEVGLKQIDRVTPVISIEVMIVESKKSNTIQGGISAGIGTNPNVVNSSGSLTPGVNVELGTAGINNIINSINGFGAVNIGNVGPNFYLNIEALEENQQLKVKSTPKIATLNGEEATLSIGQTEYYFESSNSLVASGAGTQNLVQSGQFKSVNADLAIKIKPFVSSDEEVTLTIDVSQSNFTARISENAPPGSVTRKFNSIIRVKNREVIILGGLEELTKNNAGSGLPFLARVPVIKWFFGKRIKERSKSKLSIIIIPTVTY